MSTFRETRSIDVSVSHDLLRFGWNVFRSRRNDECQGQYLLARTIEDGPDEPVAYRHAFSLEQLIRWVYFSEPLILDDENIRPVYQHGPPQPDHGRRVP